MSCLAAAMAGLFVWSTSLAAAPEGAIVQFGVKVIDDAGALIPARVLVRRLTDGRSFTPPVAVTQNIGPDVWFASSGADRLDVPSGRYELSAERGPEYEPAAATLELAANTTHELRLHRWIDMAARGYRNGENHLHVPPDGLSRILAAEGLDQGTSLQWWNGPRWTVDSSRAQAEGVSTLFDAEVENAWGAIYCVGLSRPLPVAWNPQRANLAFARAARADGGLVCYQGGWSAEALVDALLGAVDVVNVGDNLFHRHKFMPRSRNSNLLSAAGLPTYPNTADGMLQLATESYYRLLNCGLRLAAGAGSATGVKSNPAGYNRAYVRVPAGATPREFLAAWRRGRNFVTNGPMLLLTANGAEPGDTVALPGGGGKVHLRAEALSPTPLRDVRIVVNGEIVARGTSSVLEADITIERGAWIAAMATTDDGTPAAVLARYRQSSRLGGEEPTALRFAHTSPVYVTVAGRGARVERSVKEAETMLDAFEGFARRTAAPEHREEILTALAAARARLREPRVTNGATAASPEANPAIVPAPKDDAG